MKRKAAGCKDSQGYQLLPSLLNIGLLSTPRFGAEGIDDGGMSWPASTYLSMLDAPVPSLNTFALRDFCCSATCSKHINLDLPTPTQIFISLQIAPDFISTWDRKMAPG